MSPASGQTEGGHSPDPSGGGLAGVGRRLKEARTKRGWSIQQVAERIHVAIRYLEAIEDGDPAGVPAAVYIRGFIINYVRVLGMDEESILRLLDQAGSADSAFVPPVSPTSRAAAREKARVSMLPDWRRNLVIISVVIVAGIILGLSIRGISRMVSGREGVSAPPSPFEGNAAGPAGKSASRSETAIPPKGGIQAATKGGEMLRKVTVSVTAIQECWMQVQVDDAKTGDFEFKAGESRWFAGSARIRLFIGNAAGVIVSGPQGPITLPTRQGKVVHLLVTRAGVERLKMPVSPLPSSTTAR